MDAITALTQRVSVPRLTGSVPADDKLMQLRRAALRAADHGNLRPWRFLEISGAGLHKLGALFLSASQAMGEELSQPQQKRLLELPLRAPLVIVAIACIQAHPKVPRDEQLMAAACAVQNMLNAAFALNIGAYWRSGDLAFNAGVKAGLGLGAGEEIVGFVYLGEPDGELKPCPSLEPKDFFQHWG